MRLIRNIYGESPPLIMHPRLRFLRSSHITIKFVVQAILQRPRTLPTYWRSQKKPAQKQSILEACEIFLGARGSEPVEAVKYRIRVIEELLAHPAVSDKQTLELRDALNQLSPVGSLLHESADPSITEHSARERVVD